MKKFDLLLVLLFLLTGILQKTHAIGSFQKMYQTPFSYASVYSAQCPDSGYVIATSIPDTIQVGINNIQIKRTDYSGNLLWSKIIGTSNNDIVSNILVDAVGGIFLVGQTDSTGQLNSEDMFVMKLDSGGSMQWSVAVGGFSQEYVTGACLSQDSGIIITGPTLSFGSSLYNYYVVKLNRNGQKIWSRVVEGGTSYSPVVKPTYDGGYVLFGSTDTYGSFYPNMLLVKMNNLGVPQWSKTYDFNSEDWGKDIAETPDHNFFLLGVTRDGDDATVFKVDSIGNMLWAEIISVATWDIRLYNIESNPDNGCTISGEINGTPTLTDMLLLRIDTDGTVLWSNSFGGVNDDLCSSFIRLHDNSYLVTGLSMSSFAIPGIYQVKTDENGTTTCYSNVVDLLTNSLSNFTIDTSYTSLAPVDFLRTVNTNTISASGNEFAICLDTRIENISAKTCEVNVFPNPSDHKFTVDLKFVSGNKTIRISDSKGKLIEEHNTGNDTFSIDTENWNPGIFFVTVISDTYATTVKVVLSGSSGQN